MQEKKTITLSLGTVIFIFIIILLIIALAVVYYLGFIKEDNSEDNKINSVINDTATLNNEVINSTDVNQTDIEKNLDINSMQVKNLYSKILKTNNIYNNFGTNGISRQKCSFYKSTKVNANILSNEEKVVAVLQYLIDTNEGTKMSFSNIQSDVLNQMGYYFSGGDYDYCIKYSAQELEAAKKAVFGNDVQINWISIGNNAANQIDYINGEYYRYTYPGGGGPWGIYSFSEIEKATENNEYVYIYDKYLYTVLEYNPEVLNLYTNSDMNVKISSVSNYYDYENAFDNKDNSVIKNYSDKIDTYKHTFKKDSDGNCYWISTEPVR